MFTIIASIALSLGMPSGGTFTAGDPITPPVPYELAECVQDPESGLWHMSGAVPLPCGPTTDDLVPDEPLPIDENGCGPAAPCIGEPASSVATGTPPVPNATADDICHEDEPCWDCRTMGNRICGTTYYPPASELPEPPVVESYVTTPPSPFIRYI